MRPRLTTLAPKVKPLQARRLQPATVERIRGRRLMERNQQLFMRNPCCVRCEAKGIATPVTQWDHKIPIAAGGPDTEDNLQGLCDPCHDEKTAEDRKQYGF
jgi:5-methylcytosine-specific restriction protein A